MKKIIPIAFCMSISIGLMAQSNEMSYGFEISPVFGFMSSDDSEINGNGVHLGLKVRGVGDYYLSDWIIINGSAGFAFSQGGSLLHNTGGNLLPDSDLSDNTYNVGIKPLPDDVEITYSLQMLEISTSLRYLINMSSSPFDIYLAFPELHFGLVSKSTGKIDATNIHLEKEDIGSDVKAFNLAWGIGAGIQLPSSWGNYITAGLHLQKGLIDLTTNDAHKAVGTAGDYERITEDSKGTLNALVLRLTFLF